MLTYLFLHHIDNDILVCASVTLSTNILWNQDGRIISRRLYYQWRNFSFFLFISNLSDLFLILINYFRYLNYKTLNTTTFKGKCAIYRITPLSDVHSVLLVLVHVYEIHIQFFIIMFLFFIFFCLLFPTLL